MNHPQAADVCPPDDSWLRLLDETLPEPERELLEDHLGDCRRCQEAIQALAGPLPAGLDDLSPGVSGLLSPIISRALSYEPVRPPSVPGLTVLEEIGRGGMGVVFRARQESLGRDVALKTLSRSIPSAAERIVREARTLARLKHPNVVAVHHAGTFDGIPYLVLEYVPGGTLQTRIDQGPLDPHAAAHIARDLAQGLAEAHALGITHRDIKPANILIEPGEPETPKLADFGLALQGDGGRLTEPGFVLGTPCYMAPEQTGLDPTLGPIGPAADIHALGAVLFAMLAGEPPYRGDTDLQTLARVTQGRSRPLRKFRPDVPPALAAIVARCLRPRPSDRYVRAADLADDLDRFLNHRPLARRPFRLALRALRPSRRTVAVGLPAVAVAVLAGVAAVAATRTPHRASVPDRGPRIARPHLASAPPANETADALRDLRRLINLAREFRADPNVALSREATEFLIDFRRRFDAASLPAHSDPAVVANLVRSAEEPAKRLLDLAEAFLKKARMSDARVSAEAAVSLCACCKRAAPRDPQLDHRLMFARYELLRIVNDGDWKDDAVVECHRLIDEIGASGLDSADAAGILGSAVSIVTAIYGERHDEASAEEIFAHWMPDLSRRLLEPVGRPPHPGGWFPLAMNRIAALDHLNRRDTLRAHAIEVERVACSAHGEVCVGQPARSWGSVALQHLADVSLAHGAADDARRYALLRADVALRVAEKSPADEALLEDGSRAAFDAYKIRKGAGDPAVLLVLNKALALEDAWAKTASSAATTRQPQRDALSQAVRSSIR